MSTATIYLAKRKASLRAGPAFRAIHRYIQKSFKRGTLLDGLSHGNIDPPAIASTVADTNTIGAHSDRVGQPIRDLATRQLGG